MTELQPRYRPHRRKVRRLTEDVDETIRTYDPDRAPADAVKGEDVYAAGTTWTPQPDGSLLSRPYPEVRIPWWEYHVKTTRYAGPEDCTDCGGGLRSLDGTAMVCVKLTVVLEAGDDVARVKGSGGVIECGIHWVEVEGRTDG